MKKLVLSLALVSSVASAHNTVLKKFDSEKFDYANIYADALIGEFDKRLDEKLILNDKSSIFEEDVYTKILSARNYIESFDTTYSLNKKKSSVLTITNSKKYNDVINEIDRNAIRLNLKSNLKNMHQKSDNIIYPSTTTAGNLTGNTFPTGVWSLTFDDGPRAKRTATVVDNLYRRGIKATFFMLTQEAKKYVSEAENVRDSGMNIALHSYTHPDLNKASKASLAHQITDAKKDLEKLLNVETKVFRLPYGSGMRNTEVRRVIKENNYVHIFWNIDTLDWKDKDPKSILARTIKQMKLTPKKSGIILFHDIHAQSVIASEYTMDYLLENDLSVCPVEDVIDHINGKKVDCVK